MKYTAALVPLVVAFAMPAFAQGNIFRCGNTYTNDAAQARTLGCKLVEGGNVTVVEGTRVNGAAAASAPTNSVKPVSAPPVAAQPRVDSADQKARDSDARAILEAELKKAEARHAELLKEYNNGQPEKLGPETRNHQKYLDRVNELKAGIERNERDIAGLKRELGRVATATANPGPK